MRPILRKPAAVGRLFGALVLALGLANAMPLGARAADITLTQTVNGLANTILNTSLNGCSTGCGGGGGCSGFAYTVGAITNPTPVQGEGNVLANGHEYAASVTLNNVGCTWDLNHVVLAAQAAPSNWWDSRSGTAWRNSGQVAVSGGGAVGQFSSVTFKFNLLPNGDVQPGAAGSGPVNQQVLFSLYDTSTGATATCEGGCSGGYIALTARMGNFHARLDTTGSALATNAPIVVQQGGDTSITLAFRDTGAAPWLPTDSTNLEDTAVRLSVWDPQNTTACSEFYDANTWPQSAVQGYCPDAAYLTQKAEPCSLNVAAAVSSGDPLAACTGDLPNEPNYSSFTFDLHAPLTLGAGEYRQCFWPRVEVARVGGTLGSAMGTMSVDADQANVNCMTILVVP